MCIRDSLGTDNGRAEVQENAAVKLRHAVCHLLEINARAFADSLHVAGGVLVDDIRAERYVIGRGNVQFICVPEYAVLSLIHI